MKERIDWVDYGKGIGIILVVYAHLLSSGYNAGLSIPEHFFLLSDSLVYSFHMPLFFFLTGLLVEQSYAKRGAQEFLISKLKLIAYPYLIWSVLQAGVELVFSQHSTRGISLTDILSIPYLPVAQFWFLCALLWMYIMFAVFKVLGRFSLVGMAICATVLLFFPIKTDILALGGFSTGFVFFVIGVFVNHYGVDLKKLSLLPWTTVALFLGFMGSGYYVFENLIEPVRLPGGSHPLFFLFLATLGIGFCRGFAQILAGKGSWRVVKVLGVYSLEIYVAHMLVGVGARIVLLHLCNVQSPLIHMLVGITAGLAVPIIIFKVSQRLNFPYLFNPVRLAVRDA